MSTAIAASGSPPLPLLAIRRFSVAEYHEMIEAGILTENDRVELLDGWIVNKMPRNPQHETTIDRLAERFRPLVEPQWRIRIQSPVSLAGSEPEPDLSVVLNPLERYDARHPGPQDIGTLIEVSDSSLAHDREVKAPIYARAKIPAYWIVNLVGRQIEVFSTPLGKGAKARYSERAVYVAGSAVPVLLNGKEIGSIPVDDLLPPG